MSPTLFDTLLEPVFILDENKVITYCNETASQFFDANPRKVIRSKYIITEVIQFSEPIDFLDNIKNLHDASPYKEISFKTLTSHEGKAQITLQPFDSQSWLLFFRDVTLEERLQKKYRAELEQKESVIDDLKSARAQLEIYSKQLESLVEERTKEIVSLNKTMKALLDSLNQGFFIFYKDGTCSNIFSKACLDILESDPSNKKIWELLSLQQSKISGFKNWLETLFSEMLPFEDLAPLGPISRPHSQQKDISLQYFPIRNTQSQIEAVVCVASDISDLVSAQRQAEVDRAKVDSILKIIQHKKQVELFFTESKKDFSLLFTYLEPDNFESKSEEILRFLHTLKGGAASFSYLDLKTLCHECESLFIENKSNIPSTFRGLFINKITELHHLFQKIVNEYEFMFGKISVINTLEIEKADFTFILNSMPNDFEKSKLIDKYLFEPIKDHVSHYEQIVSSTAEILNKKIKPLALSGENIHIPKSRFDSFFQVLIHALRNSVDHGIESPEQRVSVGKPEAGEIHLCFLSKNQQLYIHIKDDGQGINPQKIREKLTKSNSPLASQSDAEIIYRIFDPSFSTKQEVTEISGRGVGMDAILAEVTKLGGNIKIQTEVGKFTEFIIEIPLEQKSKIQKAA